jgi:hypothetical protein
VRGNYVRIKVKAKNIFGDRIVGLTDIQLTNLASETVFSGWFPLRKNKTTIDADHGKGFDRCGSIKLRVQWVYTDTALKLHIQNAIKRYSAI